MGLIDPIHDEAAERALLGCCLCDQGTIDAVREVVTERDWYVEQHRLIWQAMTAVHRAGADVDAVTLRDELGRIGRWEVIGGAAYLDGLIDSVPSISPSHPETYARRVAEYARRRDVLIRARLAATVANDAGASREDVGQAVDALRGGWECGGNELPSLTAAEMDRLEWPDVSEWLVAGWWASEACGFLAAAEKSSKTILAIGMALCVATGTRWLNRWDVQRGRVVLVAEEDHKRRMQRRLRMVGRALGIEHRTSDLVIAAQEGANIADERGRGRIAALVRRVKPILVVLDPWRRMTPGVNENDSERVAVLLAWLRRVQVENKCAVMVLDHLRKEQATADKDSSRAAHRIRGSGDKAAWYDSLIMVRRKGDDDPEHTIRALHRDANPLSPQTLRIVWDDERHDLAINLCAPQSPPTKKPERDESREPQEGMAF